MKTMIICADGMEECEALMTYDLLYRAGVKVDLIGLSKDIVSSHSVHLVMPLTIQDIDPNDYDCLVLPGGMPGTKNLEENKLVQAFLDSFHRQGKLIAAICAAPSILLHKGLLQDDGFTCFPGFESGYRSTGEKAVKCGNIITGKGLGAVEEFAALIITELVSEEKAEEVLKQIQK